MPDPNVIRFERNGGVSPNREVEVPIRFLSLRQVLDRMSVSRSLVYQLINDDERPFPPPVHVGRRSVWLEGEVEAYMRELIETERS